MAWKAEVTGKRLDPQNLNILAEITYTSPDGSHTRTQILPGNDLTDAAIARHCQNFIEAAEARDAAMGLVTVGPVTLPRDKLSKKEIAAAQQKADLQNALGMKLQDIMRLSLFLPPDHEHLVSAKKEAQDLYEASLKQAG